ncbi:MAG TPA: Pycsar system effector family protein [Flavisolibacter sp.]|jgi:HD superfamily phosphodiesterase|nr:Pycsar system effector family protein [Flavisolibacter sp.]
MNETYEQTLAAARSFVTDLYSHRMDPRFVFHNLEHTEDVADACSLMADLASLNEEDRFVLMLSAWFHDTGYSSGHAEGHEDASIRIATDFLRDHRADENIIHRVGSCIQATKMPQSPVSQIEKILCDADLMHLATADFKPRNQLLKQERENILGEKISKKEWRKNNIQFLEGHKYFTEYGQQHLEYKKQNNLNELRKGKDRKEAEKVDEGEAFPYVFQEPGEANTDPKDLKNAERGVQTMFRTTSHNHLELSSMADNKSHILITVNSIILSVTLSSLLARLAFYPQYIIPTAILIATCLISVIFAILSTRPSVSNGRFTEDDIRNKKTNLLFFGNFHRMQLDDYQWGMNQMIKDKEYLYNTMMMDIYYLGVVLAKKYKYLRIAYTVFMWGLIIAVITFAVVAITSEVTSSSATTPSAVIDY